MIVPNIFEMKGRAKISHKLDKNVAFIDLNMARNIFCLYVYATIIYDT